MPELVVVDLAASAVPPVVEAVWDRGDAVSVLPSHAPPAWRRELLQALAPTRLIDRTGEHALDDGRPVEAGDALVIATSGTGGAARAAILTDRALDHAAFASSTALAGGIGARWLACLPLDHIGGFGVVSRALRCGLALETHDGFDADRVTEAAISGRATHTSLVTTTLRRIDPEVFVAILVGGSATPEVARNCVRTYGMTESCGGVVYDGLALNGVEVRVDPGGEILLRSPTMLRCYRDGTDPVGTDGWYRTGDAGTLDPDTGRLDVEGRIGDVIVTGGEKVWPDRVEAVLRAHRAVGDVAVVGRPDPEWGHRVVAVVVPAERGRAPRLEELRDLVSAALPRWCAPRELVLVDQLPRTALGKVRRAVLLDP